MLGVIYIILGIALLVIIFAFVILAKQRRMLTDSGEQRYDVFAISDNQLTILTGVPVSYALDEIEQITFSASKAPRSMSIYNGIMRIVKKDGKKSRPFMFNSSAYTKKSVLVSSHQEIEETIQFLMAELRQYHIRCSRLR